MDIMLEVSRSGAWIAWIKFFLKGVIASCDKTIETIHKVRQLQDAYKDRCQQARSSALLLQIVDSLFDRIAVTVPMVKDLTETSYTAAKNNVNKLVEYGILKEMGRRLRPRFFFATELLEIFES